ncbi:MAG TPA: T9SS type A sorting domain-containing protein, partial [Draconibacterium sp.]|nr:T9SS type A sorting domain-containing protein [Draconibacterium sp.]
LLSDKNQVEIGSSGKPDENEYNWKLSGLTEGWNYVNLEFSDAGKMGSPNLSAINWFRLYNKKSGSIISKIDAIQIVDKTTTSARDINRISAESAFNIYPNPLSGNFLSIDINGFDAFNKVDVRITNLLGQTVYQNTMQNTGYSSIDVSAWLKQSVYIVTVKSGQSKTSRKLIIE